jgi:hypothetical protein
VLLDQRRVLGRVIDDQVHHRPDAGRLDLSERVLQRAKAAFLGTRRKEERVQPVEVLGRVEAAGEPGVMPGVQVEPVELHLRRASCVLRPAGRGPDEALEEVVDKRRRAHRSLPRIPRIPVIGSQSQSGRLFIS